MNQNFNNAKCFANGAVGFTIYKSKVNFKLAEMGFDPLLTGLLAAAALMAA